MTLLVYSMTLVDTTSHFLVSGSNLFMSKMDPFGETEAHFSECIMYIIGQQVFFLVISIHML